MIEKTINGYKITELSSHDIADYFERAFNSSEFKESMQSAGWYMEACEKCYVALGNILRSYAVLTGDLSDNSIYKIIEDFTENRVKYFQYFDWRGYFSKHIMPDVKSITAEKLGLKPHLPH